MLVFTRALAALIIKDKIKPIRHSKIGFRLRAIMMGTKKVSVAGTYADENGKSITIRIVFSHPERTLTKDEVLDVVNCITAELEGQNIKLKGGIAL